MKIKVGKRYWRRDGGVSPLVESNDDEDFPFIAGDNAYTEGGTLYEGITYSLDLITEYTGPELVPPGEKVKRTIVLKEVMRRYGDYWTFGWESGPYPHEKLVSPDETIYTGNERVVEV